MPAVAAGLRPLRAGRAPTLHRVHHVLPCFTILVGIPPTRSALVLQPQLLERGDRSRATKVATTIAKSLFSDWDQPAHQRRPPESTQVDLAKVAAVSNRQAR